MLDAEWRKDGGAATSQSEARKICAGSRLNVYWPAYRRCGMGKQLDPSVGLG